MIFVTSLVLSLSVPRVVLICEMCDVMLLVSLKDHLISSVLIYLGLTE